MSASSDTMCEIAKALRRHLDTAALEKVVNELLDVPGNRDFRDSIEELARVPRRRNRRARCGQAARAGGVVSRITERAEPITREARLRVAEHLERDAHLLYQKTRCEG
jgi:hypothetical protein